MYDHLTGARLGLRSTQLVAGSARPDAPVVADRRPSTLRVRTQGRVAAGLHRLATALEPRRDRSVAGRVDASPVCR